MSPDLPGAFERRDGALDQISRGRDRGDAEGDRDEEQGHTPRVRAYVWVRHVAVERPERCNPPPSVGFHDRRVSRT